MDFTKSRDRTALEWNPSSNFVDFKYFIPLMQRLQPYTRNMEMDSFPHHALISYTLCSECTKADRAMIFVTLTHLAAYF